MVVLVRVPVPGRPNGKELPDDAARVTTKDSAHAIDRIDAAPPTLQCITYIN